MTMEYLSPRAHYEVKNTKSKTFYPTTGKRPVYKKSHKAAMLEGIEVTDTRVEVTKSNIKAMHTFFTEFVPFY